jgi:hypothetical protein
MFETGVQMVFQAQTHDMLKVTVINMCVDPEEPFKNDLDDLHEILRKGDP